MSEPEKPAAADRGPADAPASESAAPPAPPPASPERARPSGSGRWAAALALIVALVALGASAYLGYELLYRDATPQDDLAQRLGQVERHAGDTRAAVDELRTGTDRLRTTLAELQSRIDALGETQGTLSAAVNNLQASIGRSQMQWQLAEAEQLLLIANRRLQLGRDVQSALAALRAADRQLERLANPRLLPVRREIAREITALEGLERADVSGIALRLGSLAERADELAVDPDLERRAAQVAAAGDGNDADAGIWQDLLSLVRIRRHDEPQQPLLAPEQRYFAHQNLRLMLFGAQHALLQGDIATYEQNLRTAGEWLAQYFDPHAAAVRAAGEEIARLRAAEVAQTLPDISASLEMLRRAQAAGEEVSS